MTGVLCKYSGLLTMHLLWSEVRLMSMVMKRHFEAGILHSEDTLRLFWLHSEDQDPPAHPGLRHLKVDLIAQ